MNLAILRTFETTATTAGIHTAPVTGSPLVLLRLEGGVVLVGACLAHAALGGSWATFFALFLVPDLAMIGYLAGPRVGAASYNAAHTYLAPALLAGLGLLLGSTMLLGGACVWAAHVGFDRLLGFGLKYSTAFGDSHLGRRRLGRGNERARSAAT